MIIQQNCFVRSLRSPSLILPFSALIFSSSPLESPFILPLSLFMVSACFSFPFSSFRHLLLHEPCSPSFLAELPRFENSRNLEMMPPLTSKLFGIPKIWKNDQGSGARRQENSN